MPESVSRRSTAAIRRIVRSRRRVSAVVAALAAAALACTPHPALGTVEATRGAATRVVDLATCRVRTLRTPRPQGSIVSPDGRFRASVRASGHGRTRRNAIVVGGRPVYSTRAEGDTTG